MSEAILVMEAISTPATEAAKYSANFLGPRIGYLVYYKKYIEDLSSKADDLSSVRDDIKGKVSAAKRSGDTIFQVVERWLQKADKTLEDTKKLKGEASGINSCCTGWCFARYHLGKKAKKTITIVTELWNEGKALGEVSNPAPIHDMDLMPTEDFEAFESTKSAMDLVMKALMNDKVSIIGVHGMGGIGKTTLMRKIGNQVKMNKLFDVVVMVGVSQNHDLKKIQDDIAGDLSLSFGQERGEARARRLFMRIKQEMRALIILDDMWKTLDLTEVGIPCGEHHKGCKVVLTTRRQDVCNMMRAEVKVGMECLSEPDSWRLFRKNAGSEVDSDSLTEVARDVAKECKGLPVALVTLGRAMRDKDIYVWENVLQQLRESDFTHIEEMDARVFKAIKLSYDYLPDEETKTILLFCCLFPEDHKISMEELLRYMMGESVLKGVNLNQAKRRLHLIIGKLTSSHLLLKGDRDGYVLMHDVIRDVAIIVSRDQGFVVRAGRGLEAWPEKETVEQCKRLSLMGNELSESDLPKQPECPKILTLAMSRCQSLKNIPEGFFEGMRSLVNLDLSHTPILSLPASLACLENLRSLSLDGCLELEDVSLIGKLKKLEMISLKKTSIKMLPVKEIKEFSNLKLLALES